MAKKNGKAVLDIPVTFGGVGIGDATARIGVKIDRNDCNINMADDVFCGHRLSGQVLLGGTGDSPGQRRFVESDKIEGVFDVKQLGINTNRIATGLTFNKKDVDMDIISRFAKGSGRLIIHEVGELPDDSPAHDEEDEDGDTTLPGSLKSEGPWREFALSELFEGTILKSLRSKKLKTVGDLAEFTRDGEKSLTDIEGIGPGKEEKILNKLAEFWRDNDADDKPTALTLTLGGNSVEVAGAK